MLVGITSAFRGPPDCDGYTWNAYSFAEPAYGSNRRDSAIANVFTTSQIYYAEQGSIMTLEKRFYKPELDVLRFIAFFGVFLHHTIPRDPSGISHFEPYGPGVVAAVSNAFGFGLPLFFFLSSFLISSLLLIEKERSGSISVRSFYIRRILRIWPLYFLGLFLGLTLAVHQFYKFDDASQLKMFAFFSVFLGNWFFVNHPWNSNPFDPLWSISVEEQFYLIIPVLMILVPKRKFGLASGLLLTASLASVYVLGRFHAPIDTTIWVSTLSQSTFFSCGIFIAWAFQSSKKLETFFKGRSLFVRVVLLVFSIVSAFMATYIFDAERIANASSGAAVLTGYLLAAISVCLVFLTFYGFRNPNKFLIYLGKISFGLYVFHELGMKIAGAAWKHLDLKVHETEIHFFSLIITFILAWLSYEKFEKFFLLWRQKFSLVQSRPV